jgi:XTP/dITP diphosphohydrolase
LISRVTTFLIATRNDHKVAEIRAILGPDFHYQTLRDHPEAPAIAETADSFIGNATLKVLGLTRWLRAADRKFDGAFLHLLADDSGLEVDALGGQPGVHSARFAALDTGAVGNSPDAANNAKLLRLLQTVPLEKRTARFRCSLALLKLELASGLKELKSFSGICEGRIELAPRGPGGFGYDPLFVPNGYQQSFAELGEDVKNRLSHRAQALTKLKAAL